MLNTDSQHTCHCEKRSATKRRGNLQHEHAGDCFVVPPRNDRWKKSYVRIVLTILLIPGLFAFSSREQENQEARTLATFPTYNTDAIVSGDYFEHIDTYLADHFGWRDKLVRTRATLLYALGMSPSKDVLRGKRDMFFLSREPIHQISGEDSYTIAQLKQVTAYLDELQNILAKDGRTLLVYIAPNKHSIYPELLPKTIPKTPHDAVYQLQTYIEQHSDVPVIHAKEAILRTKSEDNFPLYYLTDTHWGNYAAFVASQALLQAIPGAKPLDETNYTRQTIHTDQGDGDLSRLLGLEGSLPNTHQDITLSAKALPYEALLGKTASGSVHIVTTASTTGPSVLIFHDSFIDAMFPFLATGLRKATFVRHSPPTLAEIDAEARTDVVIIELVERNLPRLMDAS